MAFGAWCMAEQTDRVHTIDPVSEYEPLSFLETVEPFGLQRTPEKTPARRWKASLASPIGISPLLPESQWVEKTALPRRSLAYDSPPRQISGSASSSPSRQPAKPVLQPALDGDSLEVHPPLLGDGPGPPPTGSPETTGPGLPLPGEGLELPPAAAWNFTTDALELLLAPGDLLVVPPCAAGIGRLRLCLSLPQRIRQQSPEACMLKSIWPSLPSGVAVGEIWSALVLESSRRQTGFRKVHTLFFVQRGEGSGGALTVMGEVDGSGEVTPVPYEVVDMWQSPLDLRAQLRVDLMIETVADMGSEEVDLTSVTVSCSLLRPPQEIGRVDAAMQLCDLQACWRRMSPTGSGGPFVAISFWQRYLCKLSETIWGDQGGDEKLLDVILRRLPLRADKGSLSELLTVLQSTGWVSMSQLPQLSPPAVFTMPGQEFPACLVDVGCVRLLPQTTSYGEKVPAGTFAAYGPSVYVTL